MNELALFAGAGGGILGSVLLGHRVVCAVEIAPYCREVLLRRQEDAILPAFPIWDDIRTFDCRPWCGKVDLVSGGFPCQPWSCAGKQKGETDERNLWADTLRVIREVEPRYCLLENAPGLLSKTYFGEIISGLAEAGYDARWDIVSAAETGAHHLRKRLWIVANTYCQRCDGRTGNEPKKNRGTEPKNSGRWPAEPCVDRVANGLAYRVDRIKALGNGQVPRVVKTAWLRT